MTKEDRHLLLELLQRYKDLGIAEQIDYDKFYLYSIIAHSTAIEGSTVTEVEAQLLFDEGITSSKRTLVEQMMNLDLKAAYDFGIRWIKLHEPITVDWLIKLASKVMARTGSEYHSIAGDFSSAKGELRKLNVTAGFGGRSYMSYLKVPVKLEAFCEELNKLRRAVDKEDLAAVYELSFWAHYGLVTIHPWADGNGRMSRLLMNLLQIEFGVIPAKVLKEDKSEYIQSLIDTREQDNVDIFISCMTRLHCRHLKSDIDAFTKSTDVKVVDKQALQAELTGKWSIKSSIAEKMVDILDYMADKESVTTDEIVRRFGLAPTTAKRYLRQLSESGFLIAGGGNRNRTYRCPRMAIPS